MAGGVLILDVVVDEREVVEELQRRRCGEHALRVAGQGLVHEDAHERSHALAATGALDRRGEAEVVQHHAVEGLEGRLDLRQYVADLLIDGCDPRAEPAGRCHRKSMVAGTIGLG